MLYAFWRISRDERERLAENLFSSYGHELINCIQKNISSLNNKDLYLMFSQTKTFEGFLKKTEIDGSIRELLKDNEDFVYIYYSLKLRIAYLLGISG